MDFSGLHMAQCQDSALHDAETSDFERWTPYDGRHGDHTCFMG